MAQENSKFDKILVQYPDGMVVDIMTLSSEDYEEFLEIVVHLRMVYQTLKNNENYGE